MSAGQGIGAAVGAYVGYLLAPVTGGASLALSAALMGASIGMAIGGAIDPPEMKGPDQHFDRDIQHNTFDRDLPLPISFGRVLVGGPVIFIGKAKLKELEDGGGKDGPTTTKAVYSVDAAIALGEGPIEDIVTLYKNGADKTSLEGNTNRGWDVVRGTGEQAVRNEVIKVGVLDPVPWRHTAYVMWHGNIGEQNWLPTYESVIDAIRTTRTAEGSYSSLPGSVERVQWDGFNHWMHIKRKELLGILTVDQVGANKYETGVPSDITIVNAWGVWGLERMVVYLGQVDASYNRKFAIGLLGDDGTGSGRWIADDLNLAEWGQKIMAYELDQKWGRMVAVVQTATKTVVLRLDLATLAEEKWELPAAYAPSAYEPRDVFFDREMDEFYIVGVDKTDDDWMFLRGEWGDTTLEVNQIGSGVLGRPVGFGVSGDFIIGADADGVLFRFVWNDTATFGTYGTAQASADTAPAKGEFTSILHATVAQEMGRMACLTKPGTDWYLTLTEWDGWNWSYVGQSKYSRVSFERRGDPVGAVWKLANNTRYGASIPEAALHLEEFENASGYCGEIVRNGEDVNLTENFSERWSVGLTIQQRRRWIEVMYTDVLPSFSGFLPWQAGKLDVMVSRPVLIITLRLDHTNITKGSLAWMSTDREETPNSVVINFRDSEDRYRHDLARIDDEGEQDRTGEEFQRSYNILCITDRFRAYRMAHMLLGLAIAQRIMVEVKVGHIGLSVRVGDGVAVTHDMLAGGVTDKVFRVFEVREEEKLLARLGMVENTPTAYRTPKELGLMQTSDFGTDQDIDDGGGGGSGSGGNTPNPSSETLLPPVRFNAVIHETEQAVIIVLGHRGEGDGAMHTVNIERDTSAGGAFTTLAARDSTQAHWSAYITKTFSAAEAGEIQFVKDSLLGESLTNGDDGYALIGSEVIRFTNFRKGKAKIKGITRGAKGTTAAEHRVEPIALKAAWTWDGSSVDDITSLVKTRGYHKIVAGKAVVDTTKYATSVLRKLGHWVAFGGDEKFNSIFFELASEAGGHSKSIVEFSSDAVGGWSRAPGVLDLTESLKKGSVLLRAGYADDFLQSLPGDEGFSGQGRPIYFDPPQNWTKTSKYAAGEDFGDATPRYYIRIRQLTTRSPLDRVPGIDWISLRSAAVLSAFDDSRAIRWDYPDGVKGTTQFLRATATGSESQRSSTASSPIIEIDIPA